MWQNTETPAAAVKETLTTAIAYDDAEDLTPIDWIVICIVAALSVSAFGWAGCQVIRAAL
jgi:hypothetical protein